MQLSAFLAFGRVGVADVLSTDTCVFTNTCMLPAGVDYGVFADVAYLSNWLIV